MISALKDQWAWTALFLIAKRKTAWGSVLLIPVGLLDASQVAFRDPKRVCEAGVAEAIASAAQQRFGPSGFVDVCFADGAFHWRCLYWGPLFWLHRQRMADLVIYFRLIFVFVKRGSSQVKWVHSPRICGACVRIKFFCGV